MNYNKEHIYYIVEGWFEESSGLYDNSFYGAYSTLEEPFNYIRTVLHGDDAKFAASKAISNGKISSSEISEMVTSGAIAERPMALGGVTNFRDRDILLTQDNKPKKKKKKKVKLPHSNKIGSRINTISQTGGRLGGNKF